MSQISRTISPGQLYSALYNNAYNTFIAVTWEHIVFLNVSKNHSKFVDVELS